MTADSENDLLSISVDPDDYASTAATDTPTVPQSRTYQSREDFEVQKAAYTAKIDGDKGRTYTNLIAAVPCLSPLSNGEHDAKEGKGDVKLPLTKKQIQLLHYAVGELYFDREFAEMWELCRRVKERCVVDEKLSETLEKWIGRCRERMGE